MSASASPKAEASARRSRICRPSSRPRRGSPAARCLASARLAAAAPAAAPVSAPESGNVKSRKTGFGSRTGISPEDGVRMAEMRRSGVDIVSLCETFGASKATVYRILAVQGLGRRKRGGER